jgi:hypothetical protein
VTAGSKDAANIFTAIFERFKVALTQSNFLFAEMKVIYIIALISLVDLYFGYRIKTKGKVKAWHEFVNSKINARGKVLLG